MWPGRPKPLPAMLAVLLAFMAVSGEIRRSAAEVPDITTVTPPGAEVKCGTCNVPPPPPPPPPPPKRRSPPFCPPPPPSPFYNLGPPGNLYPVDQSYWSAAPRTSVVGLLPLLLGYGLVGFLEIAWWL